MTDDERFAAAMSSEAFAATMAYARERQLARERDRERQRAKTKAWRERLANDKTIDVTEM